MGCFLIVLFKCNRIFMFNIYWYKHDYTQLAILIAYWCYSFWLDSYNWKGSFDYNQILEAQGPHCSQVQRSQMKKFFPWFILNPVSWYIEKDSKNHHWKGNGPLFEKKNKLMHTTVLLPIKVNTSDPCWHIHLIEINL